MRPRLETAVALSLAISSRDPDPATRPPATRPRLIASDPTQVDCGASDPTQVDCGALYVSTASEPMGSGQWRFRNLARRSNTTERRPEITGDRSFL
jgi:hypothetical protein